MDEEDQYWNEWGKPLEKRPNLSEVERSHESSTMTRVKHRSPNRSEPSPLLKEWMEKNGVPVK